MVSRFVLFALLQRIGCPTKLLKLIIAFYESMQKNIQQNGASSKPFPIVCGLKQGIFSLLLSYAFQKTENGLYINTRSNGKFFNLVCLISKTKTHTVLIREMLFADDASLAAPSKKALQGQVDCLFHACDDLGLEISLKKTQTMSRDTSSVPNIFIGDHMFEVVVNFVY